MIKASFITQHEDWDWKRQLPSRSSNFQGIEFFAPVDEADIIFVYDSLLKDRIQIKQSTPTVLVCTEPKNVKKYLPEFVAQFDYVITSDRDIEHANPIFIQAGLPWHLGYMSTEDKFTEHPLGYKELEKFSPTKTKLVSVVSSDKSFTKEHQDRLSFVSRLKEALGDQVDFFGRGIVDFVDKREVLDEYRYHIALENCSITDYWTEKIADPFLSLTFPIYHGCPNLTEYFPEGSFRAINIYEPKEAIKVIKDVISSNVAEENRDKLLKAREKVMKDYNIFAVLAEVGKDILKVKQVKDDKDLKYLQAENIVLNKSIKIKSRLLIKRAFRKIYAFIMRLYSKTKYFIYKEKIKCFFLVKSKYL